MSREVEDKAMWMVRKEGKFSVKSFYGGMAQRGSNLFPTRFIWNSWVSTRVRFFVWEASWRGILTLDKLKRRGWMLVSLCRGEEESCDHILFHCSKVGMLW